MNDNLALVEVFKTVFRNLRDVDGRVMHYDLVIKPINSQKSGRGGPLAMINSMLETGRIEGLPGGYYKIIPACTIVCGKCMCECVAYRNRYCR
jgi:hypothetical protein